MFARGPQFSKNIIKGWSNTEWLIKIDYIRDTDGLNTLVECRGNQAPGNKTDNNKRRHKSDA